MTVAENDLRGKTVVVTGASDGIGAATARALHSVGASVVLVGRDPGRTNAVADDLEARRLVVDYRDLAQVRQLAVDLAQECPTIDVLINNAGLVAGASRETTVDGFEVTFQVNHLASFLLTNLLRDTLVSSRARIIVTSSRASTSGQSAIDLNDLQAERGYRPLRSYSVSKLANVLFAQELTRRWSPDGVGAVSLHPGMVSSSFGSASTAAIRFVYRSPLRLLMDSPVKAAGTMVWLAACPPSDWQPGGYYDKRSCVQHPKADRELAAELWERSAQLVAIAV